MAFSKSVMKKWHQRYVLVSQSRQVSQWLGPLCWLAPSLLQISWKYMRAAGWYLLDFVGLLVVIAYTSIPDFNDRWLLFFNSSSVLFEAIFEISKQAYYYFLSKTIEVHSLKYFRYKCISDSNTMCGLFQVQSGCLTKTDVKLTTAFTKLRMFERSSTGVRPCLSRSSAAD